MHRRYKYKSWSPGVGVTAVRNPHYWNPAVHPLVEKILLKGVPDTSSFTSGLMTGGIQGGYTFGLATLSQLEHNENVKVYQGPGWSTDALIVSNPKGVLGTSRCARRCRGAQPAGIINSVYKGAALIAEVAGEPRRLRLRQVGLHRRLQRARRTLRHNITEAKKLVQQAGAPARRSPSVPPASCPTSPPIPAHTRPRPRRSA